MIKRTPIMSYPQASITKIYLPTILGHSHSIRIPTATMMNKTSIKDHSLNSRVLYKITKLIKKKEKLVKTWKTV